jgi:bifunctional UDP-N-acetylglucosamine pyrophosphorylase/glucosamine-1-phosphate N-acetyltransferase
MTSIGDGSRIGPFTHLDDCAVGRECVVENSVGVGATIGDAAHVGPFAHLPAGTTVPSGGVSGAFYTASDDR